MLKSYWSIRLLRVFARQFETFLWMLHFRHANSLANRCSSKEVANYDKENSGCIQSEWGKAYFQKKTLDQIEKQVGKSHFYKAFPMLRHFLRMAIVHLLILERPISQISDGKFYWSQYNPDFERLMLAWLMSNQLFWVTNSHSDKGFPHWFPILQFLSRLIDLLLQLLNEGILEFLSMSCPSIWDHQF